MRHCCPCQDSCIFHGRQVRAMVFKVSRSGANLLVPSPYCQSFPIMSLQSNASRWSQDSPLDPQIFDICKSSNHRVRISCDPLLCADFSQVLVPLRPGHSQGARRPPRVKLPRWPVHFGSSCPVLNARGACSRWKERCRASDG